MYGDLRATIENIVGDGQADDIIDALYAFEEISYQDHIFPIQTALSMKEDFDTDWFMKNMRTICVDNLMIFIRSMGVTFDEDQDVPLEQLNQVFTCLARIERYPFKENLYYIIDNADNSIEAFDELLAEFHGDEYVSMVDFFESVSPDLIQRLKDLCSEEMNAKEDEPVSSTPLSKEYLSLIKTFSFQLQSDEEIVKNLLVEKFENNELQITMPVAHFYNEMVRNIIDICDLEELKIGLAKYSAIAKLIFTYTLIVYIKDAKNKSIDKNLASKVYALIDTLQDDINQLDTSIKPEKLADAMVEVFKQFSITLSETV